MSVDIYCDLCPDGTRVTSSVGDGKPGVWFGDVFVPTPEPGMFVRATFDPELGVNVAIMKGHDTDLAYLVRSDGVVGSIGPTYGNSPCAARGDALAFVSSPKTLTNWRGVWPLPSSVIGTSQGVLDLDEGGSPIFTDLNRTKVISPDLTLLYPSTRGAVTIGQRQKAPDQIVAVHTNGTIATLYEGLGQFPHAQQMDDGRIGACASTPEGPKFWFLSADGSGWPAYIPPQASPLPPVVLAPLPHPIAFGYYFRLSDRPGYGDNPSAPGTVDVIVEGSVIRRADRPFIATTAPDIKLCRGWYLDVDAPDAPSSSTRIVWYRDSETWTALPPARVGDIILQRAYCGIGEPVDAFRDRACATARGLVARLPAGVGYGLVTQAFDRNGMETEEARLRQIALVADDILRAAKMPALVLAFSDGRKGGTRDHEAAFRPVHEALIAASPAVYEWPATSVPTPPEPTGPLRARLWRK